VQNWEGELEFAAFIERLAAALTALYNREVSYEDKLRLREEIFSLFQKEWADRLAERTSARFRGFARQPLNNAIVVQYLLYLKNLDIFESVYQTEGQNLVGTIEVIRDAVKRGGDPFDRVQALRERRKTSS
jgi:predicted aminopeptidase